MLRHERMTVAMVLSEIKHHTSRGQNKDRTTGEENVLNSTAKLRKTPHPAAAATENDPMVLDEGGVLAAGGLPAPLSEVAGRQGKVVRHVLEDLGSVCPVVQILDLPVPHMMDQLAELLNLEEDVLDAGRLVDHCFQVPELVIEVPKISLDVIPLRSLVPEPQLAEQLVVVPTIVSFSSLERIMEQTVEGRVGVRSLQGFPGQSSTAYSGADFPAATAEQNVDIPVPRGDRTLLSASTSSVLPVTASQGFFALFPKIKKVRSWARTRGRNCSPSRAHPRRLLSWKTPSSGCGSRMTNLASRTTLTNVL